MRIFGRDVAGALLTSVLVRQDKTVEILPRRGEPVTVTFTERGRVPLPPAESPVRPGVGGRLSNAACCCNARCDDTGSGPTLLRLATALTLSSTRRCGARPPIAGATHARTHVKVSR